MRNVCVMYRFASIFEISVCMQNSAESYILQLPRIITRHIAYYDTTVALLLRQADVKVTVLNMYFIRLR